MRGAFHHGDGRIEAVDLEFHANSDELVVRGASVEVVRGQQLQVDVGGFDARTVHLWWESSNGKRAVSIEDPAAVAELCESLPAHLTAQIDAGRRAGKRRRSSGKFLGIGCLGLSLLPVLLLALLLLVPSLAIEPALRWVPHSADQALGRQIEQQVRADGQVVDDPALATAIEGIVERLRQALPTAAFELRVAVVRDPTVNAFAAPGGFMVVHTGLIAEAASAEQVAGVLAHEIGHVVERHSMRQLLHHTGLWATVTATIGMVDFGMLVGEWTAQLSSLSYSRDQERAADAFAIDLLRRAAIDPVGLQEFFETKPAGAELGWLSTHPSDQERSRSLAALIEATTGDVTAIDLDWSAVRRAARAQH